MPEEPYQVKRSVGHHKDRYATSPPTLDRLELIVVQSYNLVSMLTLSVLGGARCE